MMCPNGCEDKIQLHFVEVAAETFKLEKDIVLKKLDGVQSVSADVVDETVIFYVQVNQNEYETHNFFKHRRWFEDKETVTVLDDGDGSVKIVAHPPFGFRAAECLDCSTVFENQADETFTKDDIIDPAETPLTYFRNLW